jgi:hypothetical protein
MTSATGASELALDAAQMRCIESRHTAGSTRSLQGLGAARLTVGVRTTNTLARHLEFADNVGLGLVLTEELGCPLSPTLNGVEHVS